MQMSISSLGDTKVVLVSGRLDSESATAFEEGCRELIKNGAKSLFVQLSSVEYLSSAGLRSLLIIGKSLQEGDGKLVLVTGPGLTRQILESAGYDKLFPICSSLAEAGKHSAGNFRLIMTKDWDVDVMNLYGRLDAEHASEVQTAGNKILEVGYIKLIISLAGLQYLSSAGLCALLNLAKLAKTRHARLFLCAPPPPVREILKVSGFDKLIPIRATVAETLVE